MSFAAQICAATEQAFKKHPKPLTLDLEIASVVIQLKATNPTTSNLQSSHRTSSRCTWPSQNADPALVCSRWTTERLRMPEAIRQRVIPRRNNLARG